MNRRVMKTLKAGGVEIVYAESGAGEPVILLHGGESTHIQYDTFRPWLGAGIRAIAYDQRDSGASVNPPDPYGIPDLAADCAALIRGLGYERAHIFGSSFGGFIALQVAVSDPGVVQSLTVGATFSDASALQAPVASEIVELSPSQRDARMLAFALSERGQADERMVAELRSVMVHRSPEADARRLARNLAESYGFKNVREMVEAIVREFGKPEFSHGVKDFVRPVRRSGAVPQPVC